MVASAAFGESASNAAEYRGVIAGLEGAAELAPGEPVEVRLTSEPVIFQMTGRLRVRTGRQPRPAALRPLRPRPHGTGQRRQPPEGQTCGDLERCAVLSCSVS
jgi:ribonuclease HI